MREQHHKEGGGRIASRRRMSGELAWPTAIDLLPDTKARLHRLSPRAYLVHEAVNEVGPVEAGHDVGPIVTQNKN